MRPLLTLLNLMFFVVLCMMVFVKSGIGEEMIKKAAKSTITEIVKEEIEKQLPSLPKLPDVKTPEQKWWK